MDVLNSHSVLHDAFARFYKHHSLNRGYTYAVPKKYTSLIKKSQFCGQITGILLPFSKNYNINLLYMSVRRKNIFDWNHISEKLTKDQIEELKDYYKSYHKKCWAYKQAMKRFKTWRLIGNSLSVILQQEDLLLQLLQVVAV